MTRHWMSAEVAACVWQRRLLLPLLLSAISACSDVPESSPPAISADSPSEGLPDWPASADASSQLVTGAPGSSQFQVWICGDSAGTNLGYTFSAVNVNSKASGVVSGSGHEVLLAKRRNRSFRWTMSGEDRVQIQFTQDDSVLEWQELTYDPRGRLTLDSSERGPLQCLRQIVDVEASLELAPVESQAEMSSASRLLVELPGHLSGNQASGFSVGAAGDLSLWICDSAAGLSAQAYFVPASEAVQGQYIEATGINAVGTGRWMTTADDVVRLDLAVQGEVILSGVRLDEQTRFTATSDRDGPLTCELESLMLPTPQDPS